MADFKPRGGLDLSVVVLTLNEEINIGRCLDSVSNNADTFVVDSGSTDSTVLIAEARGANVALRRQEGPFDIADQRNWALANLPIPTRWVLFLDADEEATTELWFQIRNSIGRGDHDSYELTPKYLFQGQWMRRSLGYPNWHARLVRLDGPRFAGGVWEDFDNKARTGRIAEPYLHHGNSKGFSDWIERHQRYSSHDAASIASYLEGQDLASFGTNRRLKARGVAARVWRARPILRFLYMYVFRAGFLDGTKALRFCLRYSVYEYMTVEKVAELRIERAGGEL